jgi:hypothetical protein
MEEPFNRNQLKFYSMKTSEKATTLRIGIISALSFLIMIFSSGLTFGHCDQMNGPLVHDAKRAISLNNVNIVLKWIPAANEAEVRESFDQMMKVRQLSPEAKELAEKSFFETIVRIHRAGEGVAFTGVKPEGTPIDERVMAADKSIEAGNLSPLEGMISKNDLPELRKRFDKVMALKNFDVNNVAAGREYIEAYVQFFKFAEGEKEGHAVQGFAGDVHASDTDHTSHIPWILTGFFFITTILFGSLHYRKNNAIF